MLVFLKRLLASRKFWIAFFGLAQSIVFQFFPSFPQAVWVSIDALCAVLIASIAAEDVGASIAKSQAVHVTLNGIPATPMAGVAVTSTSYQGNTPVSTRSNMPTTFVGSSGGSGSTGSSSRGE